MSGGTDNIELKARIADLRTTLKFAIVTIIELAKQVPNLSTGASTRIDKLLDDCKAEHGPLVQITPDQIRKTHRVVVKGDLSAYQHKQLMQAVTSRLSSD